jgi:hypothetical protein
MSMKMLELQPSLVREVEECVDEIATLSADDTGKAGRCILLRTVGNRLIARTFLSILILDVKAELEAVAQLDVQQAKLNFNYKPRPEGHLQLVDKARPGIRLRLNLTSRLSLTSINTSPDVNLWISLSPRSKITIRTKLNLRSSPQSKIMVQTKAKARPQLKSQHEVKENLKG